MAGLRAEVLLSEKVPKLHETITQQHLEDTMRRRRPLIPSGLWP